MNSRERFITACNFLKPDRTPIDYQAHYEIDRRLMEHFKVNTEAELLDLLEADFYYLSCRDISQNEGFLTCYKGERLETSENERVCPFGIRWHRRPFNNKFTVDETICGPLEHAESEQDILKHPWPKAKDFDFSLMQKEYEAHPNRVIIGGLWTGIMGDSYRLHGFQNFLMNAALQPQLIKTLVDKVTDVYLELNDAYFSAMKGKMDVWFFGNDFGSQNGLLLRPEMWCELFLENIKKLTTLAHGYGLKVMMHSCGAITQIIPFLIQAGVDILDPIQITAKDMEPGSLVKRFGGKIIFHGGLDTQEILPCGTTEEVSREADDLIDTFGSSGGYIFASSQILTPDIPVENILAMYTSARKFRQPG